MPGHCIVIHWDYADEYIQLDVAALLAGAEITTTTEWWPQERRTVTYNTTSRLRKMSGNELEITLIYEHSFNTHIRWEDARWGKSVLRVKEAAVEGKASWYDKDDDTHNDTTKWQRLPSGLFKKAKREYYSRLQREQDAFRAKLLAFDRCCVISKETMPDVLEAAHIIPSKLHGAEVVENGILLRSDIHRLYDSGCFIINPTGEIVVVRATSEHYRSILSGAQLPKKTVQRIRAALSHQWDKAAPQLAAADHHSAI